MWAVGPAGPGPRRQPTIARSPETGTRDGPARAAGRGRRSVAGYDRARSERIPDEAVTRPRPPHPALRLPRLLRRRLCGGRHADRPARAGHRRAPAGRAPARRRPSRPWPSPAPSAPVPNHRPPTPRPTTSGQTFVQQCQALADRRGLASLAILVISLVVAGVGLFWVLRKPRTDDVTAARAVARRRTRPPGVHAARAARPVRPGRCRRRGRRAGPGRHVAAGPAAGLRTTSRPPGSSGAAALSRYLPPAGLAGAATRLPDPSAAARLPAAACLPDATGPRRAAGAAGPGTACRPHRRPPCGRTRGLNRSQQAVLPVPERGSTTFPPPGGIAARRPVIQSAVMHDTDDPRLEAASALRTLNDAFVGPRHRRRRARAGSPSLAHGATRTPYRRSTRPGGAARRPRRRHVRRDSDGRDPTARRQPHDRPGRRWHHQPDLRRLRIRDRR